MFGGLPASQRVEVSVIPFVKINNFLDPERKDFAIPSKKVENAMFNLF
jgi:hypothetical protein